MRQNVVGNEQLSAVQRNKIRKVTGQPNEQADDAGELNVVPFLDIITNVLMFVLATLSVTFTTTIETNAPRGARAGPANPGLQLTVVVVPDGFSLKARGGNVAPGCSDTGEGIAVPKLGASYDFEALRTCATKLKGSAPAFKDEQGVTIAANPQIPYDVVIATMDSLRRSEHGDDLFPNVTFAVGR